MWSCEAALYDCSVTENPLGFVKLPPSMNDPTHTDRRCSLHYTEI